MGRKRKTKTPKKKKKDDSVDLQKVIAKDVNGFGLIEDMDSVEYFQTMLTGYNRASAIGGHPRQRLMVIHGPPQVGKSVLALALLESARLKGHATAVFDAEYASEKEWYGCISPKTAIEYPEDLDDMRATIYQMMDNLEKSKKVKKKTDRVSFDAGCFFVIDTVTELMPKSILDKIAKEGIDKMYPLQALWISTWMKEVIRKLVKTNSSLVLVMQERKNIDPNTRRKWKLPGGDSIQFGNCLRVRVKYSKKVLIGKQIVGVQSFYSFENNKIDGTTFEEASFFSSNGKGDTPKGVDVIREVIEEAKENRGYIKKDKDDEKESGLTIKYGDNEYFIEGGFADLREYYMGEGQREFKKLVSYMNKEVRRKK